MESRQPLFSRRQLNILIMVTAVVIALLSIPSEPLPQIERIDIQQVSLSFIRSDDRPSELRLSFALSRPSLLPVLLPSKPERLLFQLLEQRLAHATSAIQIRLHSDRISTTVTATTASELILALHQLPMLLTQAFADDTISHAIDLQRAQQYLQRDNPAPLTQADAWLRQQYPRASAGDHLGDNPIGTVSIATLNLLQQQLFSRAQLRLSLTSPAPEPIITALNSTLQQFDSGRAWVANPQPTSNIAPSIAAETVDLSPVAALQPLAGRTSAKFALTLLLSRILADLSPEAAIRLHPGSNSSWLIWLLPTATPISEQNLGQNIGQESEHALNTQIERIQQRLAALQDWELERAADDLREQLQQRMRQPDPLADQLEVIAFYQLPVDYLPQFEATIAALSRAEIRQQLLDLLQPERFSYPTTNVVSHL